ncbi:hypothetical protein Taro_046620 [Colocasia esculenta]|uniref:Uncharacterized protein n=1 Tax=Colocasia esculenta TaxID=4460 RepID=A0A843WZ91_COLES|nr:hypothetical protein [Colocasia esculenta]
MKTPLESVKTPLGRCCLEEPFVEKKTTPLRLLEDRLWGNLLVNKEILITLPEEDPNPRPDYSSRTSRFSGRGRDRDFREIS